MSNDIAATGNAPVAANSAAIIAHIGATIRVHPDWGDDNPANGTDPLYGIPLNIVHGNSTTKVNVAIDNYPAAPPIMTAKPVTVRTMAAVPRRNSGMLPMDRVEACIRRPS